MKIFKILTHFEHYFCIGKYTEKVRFSPYRAVLKREYLELGIEFLHSVKSADFGVKFSFIWAQHVFLARDPPIASVRMYCLIYTADCKGRGPMAPT